MKKTIVLTGGSKGMGKSTLLKFAENNFDILTCSRKKTDLRLIGDEIREFYPNINFNSIDSDLSDKTGCDKFIDFVNSNTDKVDVLVNNVGTFIPGELMNVKVKVASASEITTSIAVSINGTSLNPLIFSPINDPQLLDSKEFTGDIPSGNENIVFNLICV